MSNDLFRLNLKEFHQRILPLGGKRLIRVRMRVVVDLCHVLIQDPLPISFSFSEGPLSPYFSSSMLGRLGQVCSHIAARFFTWNIIRHEMQCNSQLKKAKLQSQWNGISLQGRRLSRSFLEICHSQKDDGKADQEYREVPVLVVRWQEFVARPSEDRVLDQRQCDALSSSTGKRSGLRQFCLRNHNRVRQN